MRMCGQGEGIHEGCGQGEDIHEGVWSRGGHT